MRATNYNFGAEEITAMEEATLYTDVYKALGYLTTWNMTTYPVVDVFLDPKAKEMTAVYRREPGGDIGYVIGAVWHDDHFGFHS